MIFHQGIWRLPTLTAETACALHHQAYLGAVKADASGIAPDNPYRELLKLAIDIEPLRAVTNPRDMEKVEVVSRSIMQLLHDQWSHPSLAALKMESIV
eukprot:2046140-Rhodomonas_salina.3